MIKDFTPVPKEKTQNTSSVSLRKEYEIFIESFGVKVRIATNNAETVELIIETLQAGLGGRFKIIDKTETEFYFWFGLDQNGKGAVFQNGERVVEFISPEDALSIFESRVRLTIAEYAAGKVFIHAGAVGWKDFALILPSHSYGGKTSLVAELVRRGAAYYSDEYAVIDDKGYLHPFPKTLSVRGIIDDSRQFEMPVESFGGAAGTKKIPVGMILLTKYKENSRWRPKILTAGQGIIEILPHTVPIRYNPEFSLKVLNAAANRAIIAKSFRGDVKKFADTILRFFETKTSIN